jgi:hypothetical protein
MANEDLGVRTAEANEEDVLLAQAKRDERAFVASTRFTVTASGGTANLNLANPSGSGFNANIRNFRVTTQFLGIVDVFDEFSSAPSGGTGNGIDNLLVDSGGGTDTGNMAVAQDVSFTGSNTHVQDAIPSGGPGGNIGGASMGPTPIIEPEREIVIEVTNQGGSDADAAITILYVEEERDT